MHMQHALFCFTRRRAIVVVAELLREVPHQLHRGARAVRPLERDHAEVDDIQPGLAGFPREDGETRGLAEPDLGRGL